jgi:diguanylate cyclase (GGDEF)-like protein/PAS domain S-box-containing protein
MQRDATFYRQLVDNLEEGVYFVDRERRITYWNRGAEQLTGFPRDEVEGRHCSDNILMHVDEDGRQLCDVGCPVQRVIADGAECVAQAFLHHRAGHRVPVRIRAAPIRDDSGRIVGAVETFSDNSVERAARQQAETLERLALLDALTGIGNRRYLESRLRAKLDQTQRYGWPLGVVFVDVDHFKHVNVPHGHAVGDEVLRAVARTMEGGARSFDAVGRWGGEEFVAALTSVEPPEAVAAGERLRTLVASTRVPAGSRHLHVTVSVGVTCARLDDTLESLLTRADRLMYASKAAGRNRVTSDVAPPGESG